MGIFDKVKALNLPLGSYVVFGSGPLAARGLKESHDIDIIVTPEIYEQFRKQGWEEKAMLSGSPSLVNDNFEIFRDWDFSFCSDYNPNPAKLIAEAEIINGVPFATLEEVRRWKKFFGREKDLADIKLIDDFLSQKNTV